jgi:CBS domain-containing protein
LKPILRLIQSESILAIVCHPIVVTPDSTVTDAIIHIRDYKRSGISRVCSIPQLAESPRQSCSSCVLIVEDGQLLGILTQGDIVRSIAARQDLGNLAIRDVMTANLVTLRAADFTDLHVAINLLDRHQIRHLPVVDDRNCLLGLLTYEQLQHHLVKTLTTQVLQLEAEKVGTIHELLLLDLDSPAELARKQAERESVLREITQRIRQSLDLSIVFETAVREIREFMKTDRVGIFKFQSDFNFDDGEFVAESVGAEFEPILGVKIHDPGFGEKLVRHYQKGKINVVEDIYTAGLLDREIQVLSHFQVQANLVVPLLNGPKLWGLLCIHHCSAYRSWQEIETNFIEQIAEQIGIAIQQATLYEKVQLELEIRWRAEEEIARQLRQQWGQSPSKSAIR